MVCKTVPFLKFKVLKGLLLRPLEGIDHMNQTASRRKFKIVWYIFKQNIFIKPEHNLS